MPSGICICERERFTGRTRPLPLEARGENQIGRGGSSVAARHSPRTQGRQGTECKNRSEESAAMDGGRCRAQIAPAFAALRPSLAVANQQQWVADGRLPVLGNTRAEIAQAER